MRVLTVTLMLLLIGLAGCAGDDKTTEATDGSPATDDGAGGNATVDQTPTGDVDAGNATTNATIENLVPVVNFTADVVNGTSPLLVNFTLDIEDDSENLTWVFAINGNETLNGTGSMAVFNHTFDAGLYNVTITVSDAEHSVEETFAIEVAEGIAAFEPFIRTVSVEAPCTQCGLLGASASGALTPARDTPGYTLAWVELTDDLWGMDFLLTGLNSLGNSNPEVEFADKCAYGYTGLDSPTAVGAVTGTVPEGAKCAFLWENYVNRPGSDLTIQIGGLETEA